METSEYGATTIVAEVPSGTGNDAGNKKLTKEGNGLPAAAAGNLFLYKISWLQLP